jgi:hypothetical protein
MSKKTKEEIADYLVMKAKPDIINLVNLGALRDWSERKCGMTFLQSLFEWIEVNTDCVITGFAPLQWSDLPKRFKLSDNTTFIGIAKSTSIVTLDLFHAVEQPVPVNTENNLVAKASS